MLSPDGRSSGASGGQGGSTGAAPGVSREFVDAMRTLRKRGYSPAESWSLCGGSDVTPVPRDFLAIEKESLDRTEQTLRAFRYMREPNEPVRQRLAGLTAL
jgi:hypothetical protein